MTVLQWVWTETGKEQVAPHVIYYVLRVLMFLLSFVLEDWALHEMILSPQQRRLAVILVASSYVTWTYQTHTFSNSVETLLVAWSIVMIQRILANKVRQIPNSVLDYVLTMLATLVNSIHHHPRQYPDIWHLQSYYLSRLCPHTYALSYPTFPPPTIVSSRSRYFHSRRNIPCSLSRYRFLLLRAVLPFPPDPGSYNHSHQLPFL